MHLGLFGADQLVLYQAGPVEEIGPQNVTMWVYMYVPVSLSKEINIMYSVVKAVPNVQQHDGYMYMYAGGFNNTDSSTKCPVS